MVMTKRKKLTKSQEEYIHQMQTIIASKPKKLKIRKPKRKLTGTEKAARAINSRTKSKRPITPRSDSENPFERARAKEHEKELASRKVPKKVKPKSNPLDTRPRVSKVRKVVRKKRR